MHKTKRITSLVLGFIMVIMAIPCVGAKSAPSLEGTIPTPKFVELRAESNELFEILEELPIETKVDCKELTPPGNFRVVETENSMHLPGMEPSKIYTDGYTAKQIYDINFVYSDVFEKMEMIGFIQRYPTPKDAHLVGNIYYNYGYAQLYNNIWEAYYGCYNPFANVMYVYPGAMTHVNNDGIAYLYDRDKIFKVRFKPVLVSVLYNGKRIGFDQIPVIEGGRTLVPLRAIFEKIGATVKWDGDTRTVTATKDDITISLTVDSKTAIKNGEEIALEVPAKIVGGRTLVPVRFVADCFGVKVDWKAEIRTVILKSE